jgi:hypothetical protein
MFQASVLWITFSTVLANSSVQLSDGNWSDVLLIPSRACQYDPVLDTPVNSTLFVESSRELALEYINGNLVPDESYGVDLTLVIDGDYYYGHYPETLATMLEENNPVFNALIMRITGDNTRVGAMALRYWYSFKCDMPVLIVSKNYDNILKTNSSAVLVDTINPEISFVKSAACVIFIFLPCLISVIILFTMSIRKLWRLGAPYRKNSGIIVCYQGVIQSIILCKLASFCFRL